MSDLELIPPCKTHSEHGNDTIPKRWNASPCHQFAVIPRENGDVSDSSETGW